MRYVYIFGFLLISIMLQHIIHELMHVIVAKSQGLIVEKIQWLTYHCGTKVFIKDEDKVVNGEMPITKQCAVFLFIINCGLTYLLVKYQ